MRCGGAACLPFCLCLRWFDQGCERGRGCQNFGRFCCHRSRTTNSRMTMIFFFFLIFHLLIECYYWCIRDCSCYGRLSHTSRVKDKRQSNPEARGVLILQFSQRLLQHQPSLRFPKNGGDFMTSLWRRPCWRQRCRHGQRGSVEPNN